MYMKKLLKITGIIFLSLFLIVAVLLVNIINQECFSDFGDKEKKMSELF
jgi:succinate dehydrogenase/fumarate reductase cytochrome b subunit